MNKKAAKGKDAEVCSRSIIHVDIVRRAEKSLPSHEQHPHKNPVVAFLFGNVRMRYVRRSAHGTIGGFAPAQDTQAVAACKVQARRESRVLFT